MTLKLVRHIWKTHKCNYCIFTSLHVIFSQNWPNLKEELLGMWLRMLHSRSWRGNVWCLLRNTQALNKYHHSPSVIITNGVRKVVCKLNGNVATFERFWQVLQRTPIHYLSSLLPHSFRNLTNHSLMGVTSGLVMSEVLALRGVWHFLLVGDHWSKKIYKPKMIV